MTAFRPPPAPLAEILDAIRAEYAGAAVDPAMHARGDAYADANTGALLAFRTELLKLTVSFIGDTSIDGAPDREIALAVAVTQLQDTACFVARALKRLKGGELSPVRRALAAYHLAQDVLAAPWEDAPVAAPPLTAASAAWGTA